MKTTGKTRQVLLVVGLTFILAFTLVSHVLAQNTTFTNRPAFEAAAGTAPVLLENFDAFANGQQVSQLFGGVITFASPLPTIFFGGWGAGQFSGGAIIPEPRFQGKSLVLDFSSPVFGVGGNAFDDFDGTPLVNVITLTVTTSLGTTFSIAETFPNVGDTGFLGATSSEGIVQAVFSLDNTNGNLEVDLLAVVEDGRSANQPPTAEAGANQSIHADQTVYLDGSGSFDDNTPTENLQYAWSFTSVPPGSTATLTGADTATPTFVADLPGTYVVSLVVTDADGLSSSPDEVIISSLNTPPNADAGPDQGIFVGDLVTLNGSASYDPELDPITFAWTLITRPAGSTAALSGVDTATPTFVPDLPGSYVAELIISDPFGASTPDQVTIAVITAEDFAEQQTVDAINTIRSLPPSSVTTKGNQTALGNFLTQVIEALQTGDVDKAKKKLQDAIERTDGCALRGSPDPPGGGQIKEDYINNCPDQAPVYTLLQDALDALSGP